MHFKQHMAATRLLWALARSWGREPRVCRCCGPAHHRHHCSCGRGRNGRPSCSTHLGARSRSGALANRAAGQRGSAEGAAEVRPRHVDGGRMAPPSTVSLSTQTARRGSVLCIHKWLCSSTARPPASKRSWWWSAW
jgi:hypothetical protein